MFNQLRKLFPNVSNSEIQEVVRKVGDFEHLGDRDGVWIGIRDYCGCMESVRITEVDGLLEVSYE